MRKSRQRILLRHSFFLLRLLSSFSSSSSSSSSFTSASSTSSSERPTLFQTRRSQKSPLHVRQSVSQSVSSSLFRCYFCYLESCFHFGLSTNQLNSFFSRQTKMMMYLLTNWIRGGPASAAATGVSGGGGGSSNSRWRGCCFSFRRIRGARLRAWRSCTALTYPMLDFAK